MAVLGGYFDEAGTTHPAKVLGVGGFIGTVPKWTSFEHEWRRVMRTPPLPRDTAFHMTDFASHPRRKPFNLLTDAKAASLFRRLTRIIRPRVIASVAATVVLKDYASEYPVIQVAKTPYAFCALQCLALASMALDKVGRADDEVAYIFECGAEGADELLKIKNDLINNPKWKTGYKISTLTFADRRKVIPLHAADMAVWAMRQYAEWQRFGHERMIRHELSELIENLPHYTAFYDRAELRRVKKKWREADAK